MELEATILDRLQELQRWQVEQQERLLKQQQEQRDMLSMEQDRMYKALGLSVQNLTLEDSLSAEKENVSSRNNDSSVDCPTNIDSETSFLEKDSKQGVSEGSTSQNKLPKMENVSVPMLTVPPLQLTTTRYLSSMSSTDDPSPRSETTTSRSLSTETDYEERTPRKIPNRANEVFMEGVEPLPDEKPSKMYVPLDDLPVPSPKKDFKTMLEERLRDCETNDMGERNTKPQVKYPFLKKGEGLARFKPSPNKTLNRRSRPRSSSLSASMHLRTASNSRSNTPKLKETPKSSRTSGSSRKTNIPPTAQVKLNLKNVPLPKKKVRRKSMYDAVESKPSVTKLPAKALIDMNNSSDFESKNRRELEEMRIFELLEEKAENSSFCSNSSTVLALFQQSTPIKMKNPVNGVLERKRANLETRSDASDTNLEEIVRTTGSNKIVPGSPVTKIRETVIQKDYVISQWDAQNNENTSTLDKRFPNRAIAAGTYKTTKHTTIQFNNNNNNNNGIENNKMTSSEDCSKREKCTEITRDDKRAADNLQDKESGNVSLHVRFSEYNEYKTIGLTDTSIMSNESNKKESKAWSDRSMSPDSSDVEILFSKKENIAVKPGSLTIDKLSDASSKCEFSCDEESTDRTTDNEDEDYTSVCSNEESVVEDCTGMTDKRESKDGSFSAESSDHESENLNDSGSTIGQEDDELAKVIDYADNNDTVFKSELLKNRLAEIEREIEIFRKENAALVEQREKLHQESKQLHKEFKIKGEQLERERKLNEDKLQEERKRLAREKAALESRLKDAREKSLQSKQERQKVQSLCEELDQLREEINQKESRWQAAQARQKSHMRVLQTENTRLKQELEKFRAKKSNSGHIHKYQISNTRAIHRINKQLDMKKKIARKSSSSDAENPEQNSFTKFEAENSQIDGDDNIEIDANGVTDYDDFIQKTTHKTEDDVRKKRNMYTDLLNDATEGLRGNEEIVLGEHEKSPEKLSRSVINEDERRTEGEADQRKMENSSKYSYEKIKKISQSPVAIVLENSGSQENRSPGSRSNEHDALHQSKSWSNGQFCQIDKTGQPESRQPEIREIQCPDGHTEVWYPNGNVKKIYPDRNIVKMIYYNGDVRETLEDGSIKYFYASTRSWHTSLPDGLEILEFPDGQVERRAKDGSSEVSFPDGSVRLLQSDGTEKWVLPDGTVAETFPDGDKILSFPNGQREVHTKEHKRREYPDGTVKFVYPDGTQETRYSTGRVRVKDKDGNLLKDVHH